MQPRVSIHLVASNAMSTLPDVLGSLAEQTFDDVRLRIVDNASNDGLVEFFRAHAPTTSMIRNPHDKGVAIAHNQAIRLAMQAWGQKNLDRSYVLILATNTRLHPRALATLVQTLDAQPELGAVGPVVFKLFEENTLDEALRERVESDHLSSAGRVLRRGLVPYDLGAGEVFAEQFDTQQPVFAPAQSCLLVRASALTSVQHEGDQFLDTDLRTEETYTDLAWRLHRGGWGVATVTDAHAFKFSGVYNARGTSRQGRLGLRQRDRLLLLAKHVSLAQVVLHGPWLIIGEGIRSLKAGVKDRRGWSHLRSVLPYLSVMRRKRREMRSKHREPASVINAYVR